MIYKEFLKVKRKLKFYFFTGIYDGLDAQQQFQVKRLEQMLLS
ncbi:protein of unknown function [Clostridium beijerinckii]|nr:protein of unknown function [Clostridium beijerinckii]